MFELYLLFVFCWCKYDKPDQACATEDRLRAGRAKLDGGEGRGGVGEICREGLLCQRAAPQEEAAGQNSGEGGLWVIRSAGIRDTQK